MSSPIPPPATDSDEEHRATMARLRTRRQFLWGTLLAAPVAAAAVTAPQVKKNADYRNKEKARAMARPIYSGRQIDRPLQEIVQKLARQGIDGFILGDGHHYSEPVGITQAAIMQIPDLELTHWFQEKPIEGKRDTLIDDALRTRDALYDHNHPGTRDQRKQVERRLSGWTERNHVQMVPTDNWDTPNKRLSAEVLSHSVSLDKIWEPGKYKDAFSEDLYFRSQHMAKEVAARYHDAKKHGDKFRFAFTIGRWHSDPDDTQAVQHLLREEGIRTAVIDLLPVKSAELDGMTYALTNRGQHYAILVHDPVFGQKADIDRQNRIVRIKQQDGAIWQLSSGPRQGAAKG